MVKLTNKNLMDYFNQDKNSIFLINSIIEKTKKDLDFEKFILIILKYNISIFEKNIEWSIKDKEQIDFNISKIIETCFNDHIINIKQLSLDSFNEIKTGLDKLNNNIKKKLAELYEVKTLLQNLNLDITYIKKKRIVNNDIDIYIEEFSN
jgi:hypothetical protein